MKIRFADADKNVVLEKIKEALGMRELSRMVSFNLAGDLLEVIISRMGTSRLEFTFSPHDSGLQLEMTGEKIAFTHRAFKDDVTAKLVKVLEKAGGKVSN